MEGAIGGRVLLDGGTRLRVGARPSRYSAVSRLAPCSSSSAWASSPMHASELASFHQYGLPAPDAFVYVIGVGRARRRSAAHPRARDQARRRRVGRRHGRWRSSSSGIGLGGPREPHARTCGARPVHLPGLDRTGCLRASIAASGAREPEQRGATLSRRSSEAGPGPEQLTMTTDDRRLATALPSFCRLTRPNPNVVSRPAGSRGRSTARVELPANRRGGGRQGTCPR